MSSLKSTKTIFKGLIIGAVLLVFNGCVMDEFFQKVSQDSKNEKLINEYSHKAFIHKGKKEYNEAAEYYLKAAELGHMLSQREIAELLFSGQGVQKNQQQAIAWYKKAAEQGDDYSQFALGCIYETGNGIEKNLNEAARWFFMAGKQNYKYGVAADRYNKVIQLGATRPTDLIEADRKDKEPILLKSVVLIKNKLGVAGIIFVLIISVIAFIFYGKFDSSLRIRKINIWIAPISFAAGGVILTLTAGFYTPWIDNSVVWLLCIPIIYQSYKIAKTSKSFSFIFLRIALTFVVSVFSFYAAVVVAVAVAFVLPGIVFVYLIYQFLTQKSGHSLSSSSKSEERTIYNSDGSWEKAEKMQYKNAWKGKESGKEYWDKDL